MCVYIYIYIYSLLAFRPSVLDTLGPPLLSERTRPSLRTWGIDPVGGGRGSCYKEACSQTRSPSLSKR